jgi:hypothetical protein
MINLSLKISNRVMRDIPNQEYLNIITCINPIMTLVKKKVTKKLSWFKGDAFPHQLIQMRWYNTWLDSGMSFSVNAKNIWSYDTSLATFINGFLSDGEAIEEWLTSP